MANLIATEVNAVSVGGTLPSDFVGNRGCTYLKAIACGCSVTGNYTENQLVLYKDLSTTIQEWYEYIYVLVYSRNSNTNATVHIHEYPSSSAANGWETKNISGTVISGTGNANNSTGLVTITYNTYDSSKTLLTENRTYTKTGGNINFDTSTHKADDYGFSIPVDSNTTYIKLVDYTRVWSTTQKTVGRNKYQGAYVICSDYVSVPAYTSSTVDFVSVYLNTTKPLGSTSYLNVFIVTSIGADTLVGTNLLTLTSNPASTEVIQSANTSGMIGNIYGSGRLRYFNKIGPVTCTSGTTYCVARSVLDVTQSLNTLFGLSNSTGTLIQNWESIGTFTYNSSITNYTVSWE